MNNQSNSPRFPNTKSRNVFGELPLYFLERNREKAKQIRKKLAKDFVVPHELVEKFDLF